MSNCDFGSPCTCSECRTGPVKLTCSNCNAEFTKVVLRDFELTVGRKGDSSYTFTTPRLSNEEMLCPSCK